MEELGPYPLSQNTVELPDDCKDVYIVIDVPILKDNKLKLGHSFELFGHEIIKSLRFLIRIIFPNTYEQQCHGTMIGA